MHVEKLYRRGCKGGDVGDEGCDDGPAEEIENCNTQPCPDESTCEDSLFDVAFLIEANAIAAQSENEIKQFLIDLIALYQPGIAPEHARMCLVRFSSWPETLASFNDIVDLPTAILSIDAMKACFQKISFFLMEFVILAEHHFENKSKVLWKRSRFGKWAQHCK